MPMDELERRRQSAVRDLKVIGISPDKHFEKISKMAAFVVDASYSHVCFVDETHQHIISSQGANIPRSMKREHSICPEVITKRMPIVIEDLSRSENVVHKTVHSMYGFRSYVGVPIFVEGLAVGAVATLFKNLFTPSLRQLEAIADCAELAAREALLRNNEGPNRLHGATLLQAGHCRSGTGFVPGQTRASGQASGLVTNSDKQIKRADTAEYTTKNSRISRWLLAEYGDSDKALAR